MAVDAIYIAALLALFLVTIGLIAAIDRMGADS